MPDEVFRPALLALPRVVVPLADGLVGLPRVLDEELRRLGTVEVPPLERFSSRLRRQRHRLLLRRDLPFPEPRHLSVRKRKPLVHHPEGAVSCLILPDAHFTSPLWQTGVTKSVTPSSDGLGRGARRPRRGESASCALLADEREPGLGARPDTGPFALAVRGTRQLHPRQAIRSQPGSAAVQLLRSLVDHRVSDPAWR